MRSGSFWHQATLTAPSSSGRARPPKVPSHGSRRHLLLRALGKALGKHRRSAGVPHPHGPPVSPGSYSLSVRDFDQNQGETVKHYKIRNMDNGGYYISPRVTFSSLHELVEYYTRMCRPGAGKGRSGPGADPACRQGMGIGMGMG